VDKVDLILGIDNSRSMADKQQVLSLALNDLVQALTNPPCVDGSGAPVAGQPAAGSDACPSGSQRLYLPITDIHIGVVSTSIGGHGSDSCPNQEPNACPGKVNTSNNDQGHLLARLDPCASGSVPTYLDQGFLAWDPQHKDVPPGESDTAALTSAVKQLVLGAGQVGCGYESQLESWYRFLVDPTPYQSIAVDPSQGKAVPSGTDTTLLAQRKAFLRPDSLLAIVMLSDENDCSTKEYGQFYLANQVRDPSNPSKDFHMPRARAVCATNPADPCCLNCAQATPAGCPVDPTCNVTLPLTAQEDDVNLRCWDQKRRFGIDFLYPIDRYITALTQANVPDRTGQLVPNPIFSNLDPVAHPNAPVRDPSMVVLTGIVGVPWQDLARDPADLRKGYKSAAELAQANGGHTAWDVTIGNPASYVPPLDPHMIESNQPRTGTNPITGGAIAPTTAPAGTDAINGHEYTTGTQNGVQMAPNDLEYACIFPLQQPRNCADPSAGACDCYDPKNDNPLCEPDPQNFGNRTIQARAKAYPGVRQLSLIKSLGEQGVAASICPAQQTDAVRADYAYRPAVSALVARLRKNLPTP
jgi:hypothetical protein